ncbi:hypothetical protein Aph02nite_48720 [Actinoplanes philippinensis]|uniref:Uncharacterized conserved protein, DUF58 family, contains vWF domain n=1 Tax=Actinoplanes philippinensis TaxID=35752 RepID=A0A1I2HXK7_9ACTN|nr:DUF58 domain-containing protein [Actinoplanes philippinensis]GIE78922.1 hypothetical protein Aph02nite_48720 [Actinoplanes philippinensis]SFF34193.1 Uncharacterized conserved protein, DUF58 family, contains vWF domain [Actinoplanes philippinensis]
MTGVLTAAGRALLGAGSLVGAGAWLLGYPELVPLAAAAVCAPLAGVLQVAGRFPVPGPLSATALRVPRGADVAVGTTMTARGGRTRPAVLGLAPATPAVIPRLAGGEQLPLRAALPTARRGELTVGPARCHRTDPFGLARRDGPAGGTAVTVLVHPVAAALTDPLGRRRSTAITAGDALRDYHHGDDVRHIAWRPSAHRGTLLVRPPARTETGELVVLLDTTGPDDDGFETRLDLAATLLCACAASGVAFRLLTTGGLRLSGAGRPADRTRILDTLARIGPDAAGTGGLWAARPPSTRAAILAVISDADPRTRALSRAAQGFEQTLVVRTTEAPATTGPPLIARPHPATTGNPTDPASGPQTVTTGRAAGTATRWQVVTAGSAADLAAGWHAALRHRSSR